MFIIDTLKDKLNNVIYPKTRTDAVYDANGNRLDNTLSQLNQSLTVDKLFNCNVHRAEIIKYCNAGEDISVSINEIANVVNVDAASIMLIIPEGARPTSTWQALPTNIFYNSQNNSWTVHNAGVLGDNISVNFIAVHKN